MNATFAILFLITGWNTSFIYHFHNIEFMGWVAFLCFCLSIYYGVQMVGEGIKQKEVIKNE